MAITKKDLDKLSEKFATKADLQKFATKADLQEFATKADLQKFATKADLQVLKDDYLDKIMKKLEDMSIEQKMAYVQYRRHDEKLEDHEKRISFVEDKVLTS